MVILNKLPGLRGGGLLRAASGWVFGQATLQQKARFPPSLSPPPLLRDSIASPENLRRFNSTTIPSQQGPRGSYYQRFSNTIKNSTALRPSIWLGSGVVISLLTIYEYAMTAQEYLALSDEETLHAYKPKDPQEFEVNEEIENHPFVKSLRSNPLYAESRPTLRVADKYRHTSFTAGTLSGPNMIVVPPITFLEAGGKSIVQVFYLGDNLCGHPGFIHGGVLATVLDEGLARCSFGALPNKIAMTANLTVDYRKPSPAKSYFVLRGRTTKVEGRKAWVEGRIETLVGEGEEPTLLVEASALMIEPRQAASLVRLFPESAVE